MAIDGCDSAAAARASCRRRARIRSSLNKCGGSAFERDRAMQPRVVREIDHAHAAAAEDALDAIGADLRAFGEQRRRLEKAVAVVVRLQQREHFVLDVGRLGGRADQRLALGRRRGERAIEQRADALPSIRRASAFALRRDSPVSSFFSHARASVQ